MGRHRDQRANIREDTALYRAIRQIASYGGNLPESVYQDDMDTQAREVFLTAAARGLILRMPTETGLFWQITAAGEQYVTDMRRRMKELANKRA